jgi:hypothetical protein
MVTSSFLFLQIKVLKGKHRGPLTTRQPQKQTMKLQKEIYTTDFSPQDSFYADYNVDEVIDCDDYNGLLLVADPLPIHEIATDCPKSITFPPPEQLEMGVGFGEPEEFSIVPLYLDNDSSEVRDVYYSLDYDTTIIQLIQKNTTSRTTGFSIEQECCNQEAPQLLITGRTISIETGSGPILNLKFQVDSNAPEGKYHITLTRGALGAPGTRKSHTRLIGVSFLFQRHLQYRSFVRLLEIHYLFLGTHLPLIPR